MCGGDAAFLSNFFDHLLLLMMVVVVVVVFIGAFSETNQVDKRDKSSYLRPHHVNAPKE